MRIVLNALDGYSGTTGSSTIAPDPSSGVSGSVVGGSVVSSSVVSGTTGATGGAAGGGGSDGSSITGRFSVFGPAGSSSGG